MKKLIIHRVSCRACGEMFCASSLKKAKDKHQQHIKSCKILSFWEKANKILGRELTQEEVDKLMGLT